jgi:hypothetical protein
MSTSPEEIKNVVRNIALYSRNERIRNIAATCYSLLDNDSKSLFNTALATRIANLINETRVPPIAVSVSPLYNTETLSLIQKCINDPGIMREITAIVSETCRTDSNVFGGNLFTERQIKELAYKVTKKADKPSETVVRKQPPINAGSLVGLFRRALAQFAEFKEDTSHWEFFFNNLTPLADKNYPNPMEIMARFLREDSRGEKEAPDFAATKAKVPQIGAVELILSHIEKDGPNSESFRLFVVKLDNYRKERGYSERLLADFADNLNQAGQDRVRPDIALFGAMFKTFLLYIEM